MVVNNNLLGRNAPFKLRRQIYAMRKKTPPIFAGMTVGGITTRNTFAILPLILSQLREKKSHNRKDSPLLLAKKTLLSCYGRRTVRKGR